MNYPNRHCVRLEKKKFKNGIFQPSIDATYIIHLENNGRLSSIENQLKLFQPTNIVYIVYNKGYKNCSKSIPYQLPAYDLIDTFFYIFQDANEKGYANILILEDDFLFSNDVLKQCHLSNLNHFLNKKKSEKMIYYLGCLLWAQLPYNSHTNINLISTGTHSVIYTYSARQSLLQKKNIPVFDWDIYNNFFSGIRRYVYYIPLCYQLFPETENSKNWQSILGINPVKWYIKYNNLDVQVENGYSNTYWFAKSVGYLILLLLLILVFWTIYYCWKKIKNKNMFKKIKNKR